MIANFSTRLVGGLAGTWHAAARRAGMRLAAAALLAIVVSPPAVVGLATPAAAQAPALPQVSPASLLIAKQIMQIKDIQQLFNPMVAGVIQKTRDTLLQTNLMWQKDLDETAILVARQFAPRAGDLVDATARIYASHFTEQELRDLLAFYSSPLGKKTITEEPKVLNEAVVYANDWADDLVPEIMNAMRTEMKRRGHDM
jgi:hypothetical protein